MNYSSSFRGGGGGFLVTQPVDMRDEIPHMRIVHRALRLGFPGVESASIICVNSDDVDVVDIFERILTGINQFTAKNKM